MGPDEVPLQVLREQTDWVTMPLSTIFEKLFQSGEVATDWNRGNVTFNIRRTQTCWNESGRATKMTRRLEHLS